MMNGGQPIDPGLIQALQAVSSSKEDANDLQTQLALAQQLRNSGDIPKNQTQMAGRVAIRQPLIAGIANSLQKGIGEYKQQQTLQQMKAQSAMLRDARGRIISDAQAKLNAQTDPSANHPDTNQALGVPGSTNGGVNPEGGDFSVPPPDFGPEGGDFSAPPPSDN